MDFIEHKPVASRRFLLFFAALAMVVAGCGAQEKRPTATLIAGTSLIADIVADLTNDTVAPFTLLSSVSCPSQFDMRAGDIEGLKRAGLIFLHPWQMQLANIRRVIEAANPPEGRLRIVEVDGNWMLPEIQAAATMALAAMLCEIYPDRRNEIRDRAGARRNRIAAVEEEARNAVVQEGLADIAVLCNEMQKPFLLWLGLDVIDTYARPEDWSVAETERLVRLGREREGTLVIDNLQSGGMRMSETLARDIGAAHVVLSNFPNGFPDTPTWEAAFTENINRLKKALARFDAS